MSAPDRAPATDPGLRVARCALEVVELAAFRGRATELAAIARERDCPLPAFGHASRSARALALSVRPERGLLLTERAEAGAARASWAAACTEFAAAIDLSSALAGFRLAGPAAEQVLARGCRVDLDPAAFETGRSVATLAAQVPLILVRLTAAWLLLTPASTSRHFAEWLELTGAPFGVSLEPPCSLSHVSGVPLQ